jgi:hypothetical protein
MEPSLSPVAAHQALLMCSLDGQIDPSVKEHLLPGLYSVMDAIDRDLMKALNAGLDPSSRAIFKAMYDSWTADVRVFLLVPSAWFCFVEPPTLTLTRTIAHGIQHLIGLDGMSSG